MAAGGVGADGWLDRNFPEPTNPLEKGRPQPQPHTVPWAVGWYRQVMETAMRVANR